MMLTPRLLVVAVYGLWMVTAAVQSRPTSDSGERDTEESGEPRESSVLMIPVSQLTDPNSAFAQHLRQQLSNLPENVLKAMESGLTNNEPATTDTDDQDMMMGDMPSADDPQDSSSPAPTFGRATVMPDGFADVISNRERAKKLRLDTIQSQMINFLGRNTPVIPPSPMRKSDPGSMMTNQQKDTIRIIYDNLNHLPTYHSDMFTEKTQSFYPTCDLPKHTNEDIWNTRESMNLLFNITIPKSSKGMSVNVNMARLRLYKQFVPCYTQTSNETDDSQTCQPTSIEENIRQSTANLSIGVIPLILDERQIRVSIYAYTRSLKRKRVKRKLLDSRMVPYYSDKWTDWNIRNAVKIWYKSPVRNYGISVEVEDEDGNLLPVGKFFKPMNCSGDAQMITPKPMPGFLIDLVQSVPIRNQTNNKTNAVDAFAFSLNTHNYPIMDVTTIEVPDSEANNAMLYQYTKDALEQVGSTVSASYLPTGQEDQEFQHRTRHGNHQHRINGTLPGVLSKDGHELRDQIIPQSIIQRSAQHKSSSTTEIPD